MTRNDIVDRTKGICILMVIITHMNWTKEARLNLLFPFWIEMAVPMFMVISGYTYAMSCDRNKTYSFSEFYSMNHLCKRAIRFMVPYTICFIVAVVAGGYKEGIFNVIGRFLRGGYGPGSYYTPLLIQFILIFPIIYRIIDLEPQKGIIRLFLINAIYEIIQNVYFMNEDCYRLLIFRYLFAIALGSYIYINKVNVSRYKQLACMIVGVIYIILCCYMNVNILVIDKWVGTSYIAVLYIVPLMFFVLTEKHVIIRRNVLSKLGEASYNIFLVQQIYYGVIGDNEVVTFVHGLEIIIICTFLGIIFYLIERPITRSLVRRACCYKG